MTDSNGQYYQYRSFDYSIKIKPFFQSFSNFYTLYHSFLEEVGRFFVAQLRHLEAIMSLHCLIFCLKGKLSLYRLKILQIYQQYRFIGYMYVWPVTMKTDKTWSYSRSCSCSCLCVHVHVHIMSMFMLVFSMYKFMIIKYVHVQVHHFRVHVHHL